jgi:hypothetical protein
VIDTTRALERIESAQRELPLCDCGAHTVPVARPDGVWLECTSQAGDRSALRRLLTLDLGHIERRLIVAFPMLGAAA